MSYVMSCLVLSDSVELSQNILGVLLIRKFLCQISLHYDQYFQVTCVKSLYFAVTVHF